MEGGSVAGNAHRDIENRSGKPVITSKYALDFTALLGAVLEEKAVNLDNDEENN